MATFIPFDFDSDDEVNFDEIVEVPKKEPEESTGDIEYNKTTIERYRVLRLRKMDPIAYVEVDEEYSFQFKYVWDPYTGERKNIEDKHGPLYFDPDTLIYHFYNKMLSKLWIEPSDETGGYFQGYYDSGVGAGEDFFIPSRGHHPEWYIFRLPIIDCYLTKDHNQQIITLGPKLTNDEIYQIDEIAKRKPNNFKMLFGFNRPSLVQIKGLYDQAISKTPYLKEKPNNITQEELQNLYNRANRLAVDELLQISKAQSY